LVYYIKLLLNYLISADTLSLKWKNLFLDGFAYEGFKRSFTAIVIKQGDITREDADAIVNAAIRAFWRGGVDGAIHAPQAPVCLLNAGSWSCRHGEARITGGYN
jgi:hypothetical protein